MTKAFRVFILTFMLFPSIFHLTPLAVAQDHGAEARADSAVSQILFNEDADEFSSYRVKRDGFVDITFAINTPDIIYSNLLNKLKNHPDIKGVLAGKGGPACKRF